MVAAPPSKDSHDEHTEDDEELELEMETGSEDEDIVEIQSGSDEEGEDEEENEDEEIPDPEVDEEFKTVEDWKTAIADCECAEDLQEVMVTVRPFKRCDKTNNVVTTENMNNMIEGFVQFLASGEKVPVAIMKGLTTEIFGACDLFYLIAKSLVNKMKKLGGGESTLWNIFNYLKNIPNPKESVMARCYKGKLTVLKPGRKGKNRIVNLYQAVWLSFFKKEFPSKLLLTLIPYIADNVLDGLREPHLTADFFFKIFGKGDVYAILSLGAIFQLIVKHNFEYDNFYDQVYSLTVPSVCSMDHKEKFFTLVDTFLMSSHLPAYIVAGFVKRLSRLALFAPFSAQEPLITLVKNLILRHPAIKPMIHRPAQEKLDCDPYDETKSLKECNAMDSCLWELRTVQKHWSVDVATKAQFVDKPAQKLESFVRYRNTDECFSQMMGKRFGIELASKEAQFEQEQNGSDDEQKPVKPHPKGKEVKMRKNKRRQPDASADIDTTIPTNFHVPDGKFFPKKSFLLDFDKFWTI